MSITLSLIPAIRSASVYASYDRAVATASLEWRISGGTWRKGLGFWNSGSQLQSCLYGLLPNTTYEARVIVQHSDGTSAQQSASLTTLGLEPPPPTAFIYVDPVTGNDTTGTGTQASPYKTIGKAMGYVGGAPNGRTLTPGTAIVLYPGTYSEYINTRFNAGTPSAWIHVMSYDPTNPAVLTGGGNYYGTVACVYLWEDGVTGYWALKDLVFRRPSDNAIMAYSTGLWLNNCRFEDMAGDSFIKCNNNGLTRIVNCKFIFGQGSTNEGAAIFLYRNPQGQFSLLDCEIDLAGTQGILDGVFTYPENDVNGGWCRDSEINGNTFRNTTDDAFQIEGGAKNVRAWGNRMIDCFRMFGAAAPMNGPAWFIRNIGSVKPDVYFPGWNSNEAAMLKLGGSGMQGPLYLYHNVWYAPGPATGERTGVYGDGAAKNVFARNNVIVAAQRLGYNWLQGTPQGWDYDGLAIGQAGGYYVVIYGVSTRPTSLAGVRQLTGQEMHGVDLPYSNLANLFVNPAGGDFTPLAGSPLVDVGEVIPGISDEYMGNGPDLGAVESGGVGAAYSLAVTTRGQGTTNPSGAVQVPQGQTVSIQATPSSGWAFDHWEGDLTGSANPGSVLMDRDKSVTAVFVQLPATVSVSVSGQGTINPVPGSYSVPIGNTFTITAIPAANWRFTGWTGSITSPDGTLALTVTANMNLVANFVPITYLVTIQALAGGTTSPVPGTYQYQQGEVVTITAIPSGGYYFTAWQETGSVDNPLVLLIDRDITLMAQFAQLPPTPTEYTLTIAVRGQGTIVPAPGNYQLTSGSLVTLIATPLAGYQFDHWEDDLAGSINPTTLVLDRNKSVIAVFTELPPVGQLSVNISVTGNGTTDPEPGAYLVNAGAVLQVLAIPDDGNRLDHWEYNGAMAKANPLVVQVNDNLDVTAIFVAGPGPSILPVLSVALAGLGLVMMIRRG